MIRLIQRRLIIPRGDTGTFSVPLMRAPANSGDVAVFTILDESTHTKVFNKIVPVSEDKITIEFTHDDTVNLPVGKYVWDIKFYRGPIYADEELFNGVEIDSYYAAFTLPVCEIRQTGDNLLLSDDAPTSTIAPDQLDIITAAINEAHAVQQTATEAAESATQSESAAFDYSKIAERYAKGTELGVEVDSGIGYQDNSYWYSQRAGESADTALAASDNAVTHMGIAAGHSAAAHGFALRAKEHAKIAKEAEENALAYLGAVAGHSAVTAEYAAEIEQTLTEIEEYTNNALAYVGAAAGHAGLAGEYANEAFNSASLANEYTDNALAYMGTASAHAAAAGEFAHQARESAIDAQNSVDQLTTLNVEVNTLDTNAESTAEYDVTTGTLTLGIPQNNGIDSIVLNNDYTLTINYTDDTAIVLGPIRGATGVGISSIAKTNTSGTVDTYTITYTNGSTTTFTVTNGVTPNLTIGTVDISDTAAATITGTPANPVLNLTMPYLNVDSKADKRNTVLETTLSRGRDLNSTEGTGSFAFGENVAASGMYSHAEGSYTTAAGAYSHAEGSNTEANGSRSHAEGLGTRASGTYQHVEGKYNINDPSNTYAHIVGNGNSASERSNAYTLDWQGNAWHAGKVSAGTVQTPATPTAANDLTTKQYVDGLVASVNSMGIHICANGEYNTTTLVPTIASPDTHTFYLVPDGSGNNLYQEWIYVNNAWELFGRATIDFTQYALNSDLSTVAFSGSYSDLSGTPSTADVAAIKQGTNSFNPIAPNNEDAAVFYGLTKAAGVDMAGSSNAVGTYTDSAKTAIRSMIGAVSEKIVEVSETQPTDVENKLWIEDATPTVINVPTEQEFETQLSYKANKITTTVEGPVARLTNCANNGSVENLVLDFTARQSGTGVPAPNNARTIVGMTGLTITRTGANLFDMSKLDTAQMNISKATLNDDGSLTYANDTVDRYLQQRLTGQLPAGTYSMQNYGDIQLYVQIGASDTYTYYAREHGTAIQFYYNGTDYLRFLFNKQSAGTSMTYKVMLNAGDKPLPYEPYNGQDYTISWETEAGTIYGGELNVTTGKLKVTNIVYTLNSSSQFYSGSGADGISGAANGHPRIPTRQFQQSGMGDFEIDWGAGSKKAVVMADTCGTDENLRIDVCDNSTAPVLVGATGANYIWLVVPNTSDFDTYAKIVAWVEEHPITCVLKLKNAIEYDISPVEIHTLLGVNHIVATNSEIKTITYDLDTQYVIDKLCGLQNAKAVSIMPTTINSCVDGAEGIAVQSLVAKFGPIQEGTGDPSPLNVRSINGRSELTVRRTGKNLFPGKLRYHDTELSTAYVRAGGIYTISITKTSAHQYNCGYLYENGSWANYGAIISAAASSATITLTIPDKVCGLNIYDTTNSTIPDAEGYTVQIEEGSAATVYEPYQGKDYLATWYNDVENPYGPWITYAGTIDFAAKKLIHERYAAHVCSGTETITMSGTVTGLMLFTNSNNSWMYYFDINGADATLTPAPFCSHYKGVAYVAGADLPLNCCMMYQGVNGKTFAVKTEYESADDFKAYLAAQYAAGTPVVFGNNVLVSSPKGTRDIEVEEICTTFGTNHFGCSGGQIVSLTYAADTKTYIDNGNVKTIVETTPVIIGEAGARYNCGEVSTLSITPPATGIIDIKFTSGTTPTVLTVPNTVKWPAWFDPESLETNTVYEINIMDGIYGAVMTWT